MHNEPLSPELALVDPELAARARAALPDRIAAPLRHPQRPETPPAASATPTAAPAAAPAPRPRYPRWARVVAAVWILLIGILIGGAAVPHAQDRPRVVPPAEDIVCEQPSPSTTRPALPSGPLGGPPPP